MRLQGGVGKAKDKCCKIFCCISGKFRKKMYLCYLIYYAKKINI